MASGHRYATLLHRISISIGTSATLPRESLHRSLRSVHGHILTSGFRARSHILNRLLHLYSLLGHHTTALLLYHNHNSDDIVAITTLISFSPSLPAALSLFRSSPPPSRDTVSHNALITACARASDPTAALATFRSMLLLRPSSPPDDFTFTSLLSAVSTTAPSPPFPLCSSLHSSLIKHVPTSIVSVSNALLSLYFNASFPALARRVFDEMPHRDDLTWTSIIVGYVRLSDLTTARSLFDRTPSTVHVAWNAIISGYVHHSRFHDALQLFNTMCSHRIPLDEFTYTSVLSACANAGLFAAGKAVHAHLLRAGPDFHPDSALPVQNALVTLYARCGKACDAANVFRAIRNKDEVSWNAMLSGYLNSGSVVDARELFERMPRRNLLSWTIAIAGFAQSGFGEEALKMFTRMRDEGFKPCDYVFSGAVAACAVLGALEIGRQLHAMLLRFGYACSNSASNALVTMYAKCGTVREARQAFASMPVLDAVSWNAIIAALAQHGHGYEAIDLFEEMLAEGILPDRVTYLTILSACNHAGLVDEGIGYFESMKQDHGITPGEDHYARLIDLLGRAGRIAEAKEVISLMPFPPGPLVWEAVLAGCRIHGNMDLGIYAAEQLFEMTPQHDGTYVLLSNMYASVGRWAEVARVRKLMKDRNVKKEPGCSWIEIARMVHVFHVNDTDHADAKDIYRFLEIIGARTRKLGYVPDISFVLHEMESDHKEYALSTHSEKLAVAFGLMKSPAGAMIRVMKNLRICGDCHSAIMFMALAWQREIVVRDGKRFHHFSNGSCSCGNYW